MLTVYNQEKIIDQVIENIINNSILKIELIIIDDASSDGTNQIIKKLLRNSDRLKLTNVCKIQLIRNRISRFETFCDDLGIRFSICNEVILVQSDMLINEYGFDKKMLLALHTYSDLIALSARGTCKIEPILNHYSQTLGSDLAPAKSYLKFGLDLLLKLFFKSKETKKISNVKRSEITDLESHFLEKGNIEIELIETQNLSGQAMRKIFVSDSVYRGPIIFSKLKYLEIGGLNKKGFFQGFDDHGISITAFNLRRYRVGYIYIVYSSPREFSTTSKKRSFSQSLLLYLNLLKIKFGGNVLKEMLQERESKTSQISEIRKY